MCIYTYNNLIYNFYLIRNSQKTAIFINQSDKIVYYSIFFKSNDIACKIYSTYIY